MDKKLFIGLLFVIAIILSMGCIREDVKKGSIIESDFQELDLQKFYDEVTAHHNDNSVFKTEVRSKERTILIVGMIREENGVKCIEEGKFCTPPVYTIYFEDGETCSVNEEVHLYSTSSPTGLRISQTLANGWQIREIIT